MINLLEYVVLPDIEYLGDLAVLMIQNKFSRKVLKTYIDKYNSRYNNEIYSTFNSSVNSNYNKSNYFIKK